MKTVLLPALAACGLLTVALRSASAQLDQDLMTQLPPAELVAAATAPGHSSPAGHFEFRHWHQGEPPLKMIRQEEGFCFLTGISGGFAGGGEEVHVYVGDDGYWYLGGKSMQEGVAAECAVVRFPTGLNPAPAPKHVKILAASFSFGAHFADVTARVKTLLHDGKEFPADPGWLKVDPAPYWKKCLVIFCKIGHRDAIFSADEGETVSDAAILQKARLVRSKDPKPHQAKKSVSTPEISGDAPESDEQ